MILSRCFYFSIFLIRESLRSAETTDNLKKMIFYLSCLLLGFPLISSFNHTITAIDLKIDSQPIAEFSTSNICSTIGSSKQEFKTSEASPSSRDLLYPITKSLEDNNIAEGNENPPNSLLVQNELLSNYFGINSTSTVDRVTYSSIRNSAVEENDAEAKYYLGLICLYALLPPKNDHQEKICVVNHFRSAAVTGHSTAQCAFGLLYSFGFGNLIDKNSLTAIDWFRKATKGSNPHPRSHWLLAKSLYEEWASIRGNKSYDDFNRLDNDVVYRLEDITSHLNAAIGNNIPEAMHLMALMHEYELISPRRSGDAVLDAGEISKETSYKLNMAKAAELYLQAARLGFAESNYHLGLMHAYGRGILQNYAAAMECFRRGAIQFHHPPSMRYLAILAADGNSFAYGAPRYGLAVFWFDQCRKTSGVDKITGALCLQERDKLLHLMNETLGKRAAYDLVLRESMLFQA